MKVKSIGTLLIAGLVVLSAMVVFAMPAVAQEEEEDPLKIYGIILDANGDPDVGREVIIEKENVLWGGPWRPLEAPSGWGYMPITNDTGYYSTGWCFVIFQGYGNPIDNYRMYIDGNLVAERYIGWDDWDKDLCCIFWSHRWDYQIPEFSTLAIPMGIAILSGLFFLNHRKRREE